MAIFGFKSKHEVEVEKQQAAESAVRKAEAANKYNVGNLGRGSQFDMTIPWFDAFDPRLQDTGVPVAVDLAIVYAIEDMGTFLSMNKMERFEDKVFEQKLRGGVTKYVKSAVSNAPCDAQIPLVQIERKIVELSDYVQSRVIPQIENVFCVKVRSLDLKSIRIDKSSRAFRELETLTAGFEQQRMANMQSAQLQNMNLQNQMQNDQLKMQYEQMRAQHNAQLSNFNLQNQMQQDQLKMQSSLNLDAMQRQHEMQLGGQEKMQQMQLDMQQRQINMQLNNQSETMRVQREEMQRAARLQTESTFLDAHKLNLNAGTINNAMDNGFNPYEQQSMGLGGMQSMGLGGMQSMNMGGMQQPMMGGMLGQKSMCGAQPMVSYMMYVNGQQAGPYNWAQLQQLVQQGQMTQQSYVWKQGMAEWTPAGQVQELAPLFQGMAPGMPQMM